MKKTKITALTAILLLLLTGCAELVEGEVVDKSYSPAHSTTSFMFVGKSMIPQTHYYPESWYLKIDSEEHEKVKSISVPEQDYVNTEIGDFYSNEHLIPEEAKE